MGLFTKTNIPIDEVKQLRTQGMSDNQIIDDLKAKKFSLTQINDALAQSAIAAPDTPMTGPEATSAPIQPGPMPGEEAPQPTEQMGEDMYGRIEEIAEGIIDEKWDSLIEEVKKIIEWKDGVEGTITKLHGDVDKLKTDFGELHQGVLGKLEDYDTRMGEVGTELKAVGKVFKDVVPEFVENVKELKSITKKVKKK